MRTHILLDRPVRAIVFSFMGLCVAAMAVAVTMKAHIIGAAAMQRALGLLIGIMAAVIGNFLPKVRPLQTPGRDPAKAAAAERFAGWVLILTGIAYVALFMFTQLDFARTVSAIIGIIAMLIIAANCVRLVPSPGLRHRQPTEVSLTMNKRSAEKRRLIVLLLFAFFWILTTACATSLFAHKSGGDNLTWLIPAAFWMLYRPSRDFTR